MKDWLSFTFLGFFNKNYSKKGRGRKFFNVLLSLFLFILLFPLLLTLGNSFSFTYNWNHNKELSKTINYMFVENHINYQLKNHKLSCDSLINTFENESDEKYKQNNFNLIVDTRDQNTTYDDFVFVAKNSSGEEVSYSPKLIGDQNFSFFFSYSGTALDVDAKQETYLNYLEEISNQENENYNKLARSDFDSLKNKKDSMSIDEYANKVYELFVMYYYPDLTKTGSTSAIPIIRGFYFTKYITQNISDNSVMLFDNLIIVSFKDSKNQKFVYDGYLSTNGKTITTSDETSESQTKNNIYSLLNETFRSGFGLDITIYFINVFRLTPIILIYVVLFALIDFLILKRKKQEVSYLDNCLIYCSFMNTPSILISVLGLLLSIFLVRGVAFSITIYILLSLVVLRGILQIIFAVSTPSIVKEKTEVLNDGQ